MRSAQDRPSARHDKRSEWLVFSPLEALHRAVARAPRTATEAPRPVVHTGVTAHRAHAVTVAANPAVVAVAGLPRRAHRAGAGVPLAAAAARVGLAAAVAVGVGAVHRPRAAGCTHGALAR